MLVRIICAGLTALCLATLLFANALEQLDSDEFDLRDWLDWAEAATSGSPIVFHRLVWGLLPSDPWSRAALIGFDEHGLVAEANTPAEVWILVQRAEEWDLVYKTDMAERLAEQELPKGFEVSLRDVQVVNLDSDRDKEIAIFWEVAPEWAISLTNYQTVLHILDYDSASQAYKEVSQDALVYSTYKELIELQDVDADPEMEIVSYREVWEGDTCVECAKRYELGVWTLADGTLIADPSWNNGATMETEVAYSFEECSLPALRLLTLKAGACTNQSHEQ